MRKFNFSQKIIQWFDKHGRKNLPWQQNRSAYRVWVSEIMLQQTQVTTVIPYYERFMQRFPTVESLAKAPLDEVLHLWTGLGYYARARNLQKAAIIICEHYQGQFPIAFEEVCSLPGIGRSTAGAILALSQEQRLPILDGNVKRVFSRFFAIHNQGKPSDLDKTLWAKAESLLPKTRLRDYTQALMDLGATVCLRSKPKCYDCPIHQNCQARLRNEISILPTPKKKIEKPVKKGHFLILLGANKKTVLLEKRPMVGIWGGLWCFPEVVNPKLLTNFTQKSIFTKFRHTFTHFHLDLCAYLFTLDNNSRKNSVMKKLLNYENHNILERKFKEKQYYWQELKTLPKVGLSAPVKKIFKELQCQELCSA